MENLTIDLLVMVIEEIMTETPAKQIELDEIKSVAKIWDLGFADLAVAPDREFVKAISDKLGRGRWVQCLWLGGDFKWVAFELELK